MLAQEDQKKQRKNTCFAPCPLQVPELVKEYMAGDTLLDKYITHTMPFEEINTAFDLLHSGQTLRTVLTFSD